MVCGEPEFLQFGILIFRTHSKEENVAIQSANEELKHEVTKQLSQQEKYIMREMETGLKTPLLTPAIPSLHKLKQHMEGACPNGSGSNLKNDKRRKKQFIFLH